MKKIISAVLALSLLFSGGATVLAQDNDHGQGQDKKQNRLETGKKSGGNSNKTNGNLQIVLNFPDVTGADVEWALQYIASLASKGVFEGYEDGTFQPRKPITRIEALTAAVRLMGLREQAESAEKMNAGLNFKDADQIKKRYSWATGYVAVAVENDLFQETDYSVQPDKAADRLWATTLLVKAMKLGSEASARMNEKLPFKDASSIPAGSVGYVAVALEYGLIDGYEDNTFRPNKTVTRAELAALLDRTGEQLPGEEEETADFAVYGLYSGMTLTPQGQIATVSITQNVYSTVQEAVYNVAPDVSINGGTLPAPGRTLELKGTGAVVKEINLLQ